MNECRYDRDAEDYLGADGKPCRHDSYGDPTHHCTARRTCAQHVGSGELTCARCLGRTRTDLNQIPKLAAAMPAEAIQAGVNSEATNLAGPAANYQTFSARRTIDKRWIFNNIPEANWERAMLALLAADDEHHPLLVLGRWDLFIRDDYNHPSDDPLTIDNATEYLDRQLGRIAQDANQDFPQFAREIRKCRNHLEVVLHNSQAKDRGAPCPDCTSDQTGVGPRLLREYGHWCTEDNCELIHYLDDSGDEWVCPRNGTHRWSHERYKAYVEERQTAS